MLISREEEEREEEESEGEKKMKYTECEKGVSCVLVGTHALKF